MSAPADREGYWYTRADGEREWREKPTCECGGELDFQRIKDIAIAQEGEIITRVTCLSCGEIAGEFSKPTQADLTRGQELARKYGW